MSRALDLELIYEQRILLNEYSEGFIKKEIQRLRPQVPRTISDDEIRQTIVRFDQLKTSKETGIRIKNIIQDIVPAENSRSPEREAARIEKLKKTPFDVTLYTWKDLEFVVHQFVDPNERKALKGRLTKTEDSKDIETTEEKEGAVSKITGATFVHRKGDISIYCSKTKEQAIDIKLYLCKKNNIESKQTFGVHTYGWCTNSITNNRWDEYRYRAGGTGASQYVVIDNSLPATHPEHVMILHAQQDGQYRVTDAFNNMTRERVGPWSLVIERQPKLEGLQDYITFLPYTAEEEIKLIRDGGLRAQNFKQLKTFKGKQSYITQGGKIYKESYLKLDSVLQHHYINVQCHPDITDPNMSYRFNKVFHAFADQTIEDVERLEDARAKVLDTLEHLTDEEFEAGWSMETDPVTGKEKRVRGINAQEYAPYFNDPVIARSSKGQTYKLWKKFAAHIVDAMMNNTVENRGYATNA